MFVYIYIRAVKRIQFLIRLITGFCGLIMINHIYTFTGLSRLGMGIVWVFSDTGAKPVLLKRYRCLNGA